MMQLVANSTTRLSNAYTTNSCLLASSVWCVSTPLNKKLASHKLCLWNSCTSSVIPFRLAACSVIRCIVLVRCILQQVAASIQLTRLIAARKPIQGLQRI